MDETPLTTGRLAEAGGVAVETVRCYERRGLLPLPVRDPAGRRLYGLADLRRLRFIRRAQGLGFTLEEIRQLLEMRVQPRRSCRKVAVAADSVMRRITETIRDLERIHRSLETLRAACHDGVPTGECPILDALEESR
jgi:DNA-binding transcriptional MerR regulator